MARPQGNQPTQSTTQPPPPPAAPGPVTTKQQEDELLGVPSASEVKAQRPYGPSFPVSFHFVQDQAPYCALITLVKKNDVVDLVVFRPDGHNLRFYDVPKRNDRQKVGVWDFPEWMD